MVVDGRNIRKGRKISARICIIGGGAAGITVAKRLMKERTDICLVESGGLESTNGAQELYKGYNTGYDYFKLNACRLRYFGGSTNHWAGYCSELQSLDFEKRGWVKNSGWPIKKRDLRKFYEKAKKICDIKEVKNPEKSKIMKESELVENKKIFFSEPTRFGKKYRKEILKSDKVKLLTNSTVTELVENKYGNSVNKAIVKCLNNNRYIINADIFVLACGGIENPKILLQSDRVKRCGIGNEGDSVGRYFMEHPSANTAKVIFRKRKELKNYRHDRFINDENNNVSYVFKPKYGVQKKKRILNSHCRLNMFTSSYHAFMRIKHHLLADKLSFGAGYSKEVLKNMKRISQDPLSVIEGINNRLSGQKLHDQYDKFRVLSLKTYTEQIPKRSSRIYLSNERDKIGQRKVNLNWKISDLERKTLYETTKLLAREMGSKNLARFRVRNTSHQSNNAINIEGNHHHIGTTRMGKNTTNSVCNTNCRVHNCQNLYITGSSIFPTSSSLPPTLTIVALSLRLADHLAHISK